MKMLAHRIDPLIVIIIECRGKIGLVLNRIGQSFRIVDGICSTGTGKRQCQMGSIADQHHFYGQLATEESGRKIGVPPAGRPVSAEELAQTEKNPGLQRALRFYSMNLRTEGTQIGRAHV